MAKRILLKKMLAQVHSLEKIRKPIIDLSQAERRENHVENRGSPRVLSKSEIELFDLQL